MHLMNLIKLEIFLAIQNLLYVHSYSNIQRRQTRRINIDYLNSFKNQISLILDKNFRIKKINQPLPMVSSRNDFEFLDLCFLTAFSIYKKELFVSNFISIEKFFDCTKWYLEFKQYQCTEDFPTKIFKKDDKGNKLFNEDFHLDNNIYSLLFLYKILEVKKLLQFFAELLHNSIENLEIKVKNMKAIKNDVDNKKNQKNSQVINSEFRKPNLNISFTSVEKNKTKRSKNENDLYRKQLNEIAKEELLYIFTSIKGHGYKIDLELYLILNCFIIQTLYYIKKESKYLDLQEDFIEEFEIEALKFYNSYILRFNIFFCDREIKNESSKRQDKNFSLKSSFFLIQEKICNIATQISSLKKIFLRRNSKSFNSNYNNISYEIDNSVHNQLYNRIDTNNNSVHNQLYNTVDSNNNNSVYNGVNNFSKSEQKEISREKPNPECSFTENINKSDFSDSQISNRMLKNCQPTTSNNSVNFSSVIQSNNQTENQSSHLNVIHETDRNFHRIPNKKDLSTVKKMEFFEYEIPINYHEIIRTQKKNSLNSMTALDQKPNYINIYQYKSSDNNKFHNNDTDNNGTQTNLDLIQTNINKKEETKAQITENQSHKICFQMKPTEISNYKHFLKKFELKFPQKNKNTMNECFIILMKKLYILLDKELFKIKNKDYNLFIYSVDDIQKKQYFSIEIRFNYLSSDDKNLD